MTIKAMYSVGLCCLAMALFGAAHTASAQTNVAINSTGAPAAASAMLDVSSTTGGMLVPRMTQAEKLAIASPVSGLIIYQTNNGEGFWYFDGISFEWVMLPKYMAANVAMADPPSTIVSGAGFSVTRLQQGIDQINFNTSYASPPNIILSNADTDGFPSVIEDYCIPLYSSCSCQYINKVMVYRGHSPAPGNLLISNDFTGCGGDPGSYKFYPPGHSVYDPSSGNPDICYGMPANGFTIDYAGAPELGACGLGHVTVWIDWLQDGFFDNSTAANGDMVIESGQLQWNINGLNVTNLTIPGGANVGAGTTYMRVMSSPNPGNASNSCPGGPMGETEEYYVNITCGPPPSYNDVPTYCNLGDVTAFGYRVSCRRLGGELLNAQNYYFQANENE